ncbi:hybrid sensor histidine kinase/response regulator transcription factor [Spongiimicrobium salis]|uniref:hybrid sensor histidine kinase/response regulator transcription factor n=1 Tax=Spongiimicrobium salis TaxID=1667022 RepID=UPI00374CD79F
MWSTAVIPQENFEDFSFVNIKEGISRRAVSTMIEDHHGFKWIGTSGAGIYRYDGINYISYSYDGSQDTSISSNLIYCTYLDKENRLWIGTDNGLNLYNRDLDEFIRIDLNKGLNPRIESIFLVECLLEDGEGNLLVGTTNAGLLKLNLDTFEMARVPLEEPVYDFFEINNVAKNSKGEIYAVTNLGLKKYDRNRNVLVRYRYSEAGNIKSIDEPINAIIFDSRDNLWLGTTEQGIIKIPEHEGKPEVQRYLVSNKKIFSMLELEGDKILCGTENDGLLLLNGEGEILKRYVNNKFDKNSIKSNSVWSIHQDKEDRIWLGYFNSGVGVYDRLYNKFHAIESLPNETNSLQNGAVTGIIKDAAGKLWITMDGGGIDIYDPDTRKIEHINNSNTTKYSGLTTNQIISIFIDSQENSWVSSWNGGIYFLKNGSKEFVNYTIDNTDGGLLSNKIFSITEDSQGYIWIATFENGLHFYDPYQNRFFPCTDKPFADHALVDANIRTVLADRNDNIWLGTTSGLFKVRRESSGAFTVVSLKNRMSEKLKEHPSTHLIQSVYEAKDGKIWVGTDGGGLVIYDSEEDNFKALNNVPGLSLKSISAIVEDKNGTFWISGKSGIAKLEADFSKATIFTVDDGLLVNDFNDNAIYVDDNGVLYFGSYLGVNYFNPNRLPENTSEPSLYFTDFKLFNKSVLPGGANSPLDKVISETKTITLKHKQSVFSLEYVGINYTRPEKTQYAYFLEGLDSEWNYVGNVRTANYTNLAHGDYVFKVKSANNDGVWNTAPLTLKIRVLPPWWKTNWAYVSYVILFFIGVFAVNAFQKNRYREKRAVEFERDKRIQEERLNAKKIQFFTNISHEFRTPLTLIMNPLLDLIKNPNLDLPDVVQQKHQIIYKNSDRLSRLINELMDFRKLQSNKILIQVREMDVVQQVRDILTYFEDEAVNRQIVLEFQPEVEKLQSWLDSNMLEKILFNILSNAFKVTPNNGRISVFISRKQGSVQLPLVSSEEAVEVFELSVRDTGPGLDQKEYKRIFKRFYQVGKLNKSYYGSTGIGLEVVKDFVELHKGKIEVESEIGKGTEFIMTFPLGKAHFSENELFRKEEDDYVLDNRQTLGTNAPDAKETEAVETVENPYTLLIVEDNAALLEYLQAEFRKQFKIITAENGAEGLKMAQEKLPDIIITDVVMPEMDGMELCKQIKKDLKTSHIPLLMLTAKTMIADRLEGIDSGADAYLDKPFDMGILKATLLQLLSSRKILFDKYYKGVTKTSHTKTTSVDNEFIQKVLDFTHKNISEPDLSVELLASQFFLSRSQLYRKTKALTGVSVNEFIRKVRLEKAKELLESGEGNISEITYKVGFSSPSYFTKCFKAEFGYLPTDTPLN